MAKKTKKFDFKMLGGIALAIAIFATAIFLVSGNRQAQAESEGSAISISFTFSQLKELISLIPGFGGDDSLGGTRFPSGLSADSTSPSSGEVRGTTFTSTGAVTFGGAATLSSTASVAGALTTDAGHIKSYTNSTSTTATTQTLVEADILNYDTLLLTPNTGSLTLTLPATSTMTSMLPNAGDRQELCIYNATSTASVTITLVAGSGIDLEGVATSTTDGTTGVVLPIQEQNIACLKFMRETDTDVSALMISGRDLD